MIYIAHRGNYVGESKLENHPDHIKDALRLGFNVEVDVWCDNQQLYLGHDKPIYKIDPDFFDQRFWIHCKNREALDYFIINSKNVLNYFWHEEDQYTLTSKNYIWAYPGSPLSENSIMVMPEDQDPTLENTKFVECYGICSDEVQHIKVLRDWRNHIQ